MKFRMLVGALLIIAYSLAAGCTPAAPATPSPAAQPTIPAAPVTLQYIGHSAVLITAPDGTRIVSDPYKDRPSGLAPFPTGLAADAVTVSHFHPDHSNVSAIQGKPKVLLNPGPYQIGMVNIMGYPGDHGLVNGQSEGTNTVFVFDIGGVKVVHLGAAGVVTQSDILEAMQGADVAVVDVMGDEAHPMKDELDQLMELKVRTILPTHYSFEDNPAYYGSATLDQFLQIVPSDLPVVKHGSVLEIRTNMPKQVIVLAPSANEGQ